MLVSPPQLFKNAEKGHYAIGAFNTYNLETTQAIIKAAEVQRSPAVIQISETTLNFAGFESSKAIIEMVKILIEESKIPFVLHLDHGKTYETIVRCVDVGFSSVMIDGSSLPFEENVKITKKVTDYAHQFNIWVEGELGKVPKEKTVREATSIQKTDSKEAQEFAQITGIDSLAIAVGNVHGLYRETEPGLDFGRIEEIRELVKIPLVLHGGSGIPDAQIKKAIELGIAKINIDTELCLAFTGALREFFQAQVKTADPRKIMALARDAVQEKVEEKIKLFGSSGKI